MKIGDRVIGTEKSYKWNSKLPGLKGRIVKTDMGDPGIEFDEPCGGHSCNGKGKMGYCWFLNKYEFEIISNEPQYDIY